MECSPSHAKRRVKGGFTYRRKLLLPSNTGPPLTPTPPLRSGAGSVGRKPVAPVAAAASTSADSRHNRHCPSRLPLSLILARRPAMATVAACACVGSEEEEEHAR